ncbi:ferritin-like domain-containing protein [Candidatus Dependentiae bacterium]
MKKLILAMALTILAIIPGCKWFSTQEESECSGVVKMLNVALAEEWLAAYQYWIGAQVAKGALGQQASEEFLEHYHEELEHAQKIADRIMQLDGVPVLNPKEWFTLSPHGFDHPTNFDAKKLIEQNIASERRAIKTYNKILTVVHGKDHATYDLVSGILRDEIEHENELERLIE